MSKFSNRFNKSNNPILNSALKQGAKNKQAEVLDASLTNVKSEVEPLTISGTINKTLLLLVVMLTTAALGYSLGSPLLMFGGAIVGLIAVIAGSYKPAYAHIAAPIYAIAEGFFVGSISNVYAHAYNGIIFQAASLTVAILLGMLFLYQSELIKVTARVRSIITMATVAVVGVYLLSFVLGFFGINLPYLHTGGTMGIVISSVILGIASLNFLLDFDNIEKGAAAGISKQYEWVFSMGLLVTIVWVYIELLRLLSLLSGDD